MGLVISGVGIENRNSESEKSLGRPMYRDESTGNLEKGDALNFSSVVLYRTWNM